MRLLHLSRTLSALLVALQLSACSSSRAPLAPSLAMVESLPSSGGSTSAHSELEAPVVMVHFFASWCTQCIFEFPHLVALRRTIDPARLGIVAIAIDDSPEAVAKLTASYDFPFPVLLDNGSDAKSAFAVTDLPLTVFLSRDGKPVMIQDAKSGSPTNRFEGAYEWDRGAALAAVESVL